MSKNPVESLIETLYRAKQLPPSHCDCCCHESHSPKTYNSTEANLTRTCRNKTGQPPYQTKQAKQKTTIQHKLIELKREK